MKKIIPILLLLFVAITNAQAQTNPCPGGFSQLIVQIVPDAWPYETSWELNDINGAQVDSGGSVGDTICISASSCYVFTIYDSYGDGIYAPGGYWLYLNGQQIATGYNYGYQDQVVINCPPGSFCSQPATLTAGNHNTIYDNHYYTFTAPTTGIYNITTCGTNNCDTKIWVYSSCNSQSGDEGPPGTYAYNDNANCGLQAELDVIFMAGQSYIVRIGDSNDNCTGTVNFSFSYVGPISGCIDPNACNFNPLAAIDDGSCIYAPNPGCTGPDLVFDSLAFVSSLGLQTIAAGTCDVAEGCVTGYGTRYVISFTSKIDNIGNLDYIVGTPSGNPTMFNTVNCHGHAHYEGYGDYRLYDNNGNLIPAGHKNGFCVMDLCGWGTYNCGYMGISAGCYDVYGAGTQCQWIDITDVPDGQYRLAVIINSRHLPDAFNHYEINHANNALQVCMQITRNAAGVPSFTILPNCTPFVDCMGIPGGAAVLDCNGVCAGTGIYGNLNNDLALDTTDVFEYANMLESMAGSSATCYDLNGDGQVSVYDAALALWCINTPHAPHPAGTNTNECNFPRNILNPNDTAALAITTVDFTNGFMDIEIRNSDADIKAYQFTVSGITPSMVVSLADPVEFPVDIRLMNGGTSLFAISRQDSSLMRSATSQPLCRIYFTAVTDTVICIDNIRDIVNQNTERLVTYTYGGCVPTSFTSVSESNNSQVFTLAPNPVQEQLRLQILHYQEGMSYEVTDPSGRILIANTRISNPSMMIETGKWSSGVYLLRVYSNGASSVQRFTKL